MRIEGFKKAFVDADLPIRAEYLVDGGFDLQDGIRGAEQLLSLRYPPTAIVAANDLVAIGVIATLKKHGHRVPADISVVGIDDIQMAALLDPPLTTVTQPIYEMGRQGMENILLRIQNPELDTSEILFETRPNHSTIHRTAIEQRQATPGNLAPHPQKMETSQKYRKRSDAPAISPSTQARWHSSPAWQVLSPRSFAPPEPRVQRKWFAGRDQPDRRRARQSSAESSQGV